MFGFRALITNSYIIRNDPKIREEALSKGLHELLDFPGVIMTDSGTFQSHMYGEVDLMNKDIVEFQTGHRLGHRNGAGHLRGTGLEQGAHR